MTNERPRDIDEALDELIECINAYASDNDVEQLGGRRVGHTPWVGSMGYLHILYPPAQLDDIASIAPTVGRQPPDSYVQLLRRFNGLNLFADSLAIYGLRAHYDRRPEAAMWQPYDVGTGNLDRTGLETDDFCLGCIGPDRDKIVLRARTNDVARLEAASHTFVEAWPSLSVFLRDECTRFAECFETSGHIKENLPVHPGKAPPFPQMDLASIKPRFGSSAWWRNLRDRLGP